MRECLVCHNPLPETVHPLTKYCSDKCRKKNKNKLRKKRRKAEYKQRPKQKCIRCGTMFRIIKRGSRFYCPACSAAVRQEREKKYYKARMERNPDYLVKHYCPNCGVEVRKKGETFCSRCRRKYKILR